MSTQTERLLAYLHAHPDASGLEIIEALHMPKYTSRISDLRAKGIDVVAFRDRETIWRYRIMEPGQGELWDLVPIEAAPVSRYPR